MLRFFKKSVLYLVFFSLRPNVQQATFADKVGDGDAIGSGKKARQMARLQSGASGDALGSQVSRLAELVSKLEGKVRERKRG